jgi:hypothetical protein
MLPRSLNLAARARFSCYVDSTVAVMASLAHLLIPALKRIFKVV